MSGISKKLMGTTAAGGGFTAIEDVFSTYLYTGTGSALTITNGIDLAGEGGLVWSKARSATQVHTLFDTERGATKSLFSNLTNGEITLGDALTGFTSSGYTLGADASGPNINGSGTTYASWTFRKAPRFFDVVTYTGDSVAGRTISHDLGVEPGCIIVKRTNTTGSWMVYHRGIDATSPEDYHLALNFNFSINDLGQSPASPSNMWNQTAPTDTQFSVGVDSNVNDSGGTYVAYLFAHDPLGPSGDGSDGLIACGGFTTDGSGAATVNLGWEPQWILAKRSDNVQDWKIIDTMRGFAIPASSDAPLFPNSSAAEGAGSDWGAPTATGFIADSQASSANFIYIAIRRGPMRAPTSGTEVFDVVSQTPNANLTGTKVTSQAGVVDAVITTQRSHSGLPSTAVVDRMRGGNIHLATNSTAADNVRPTYFWYLDHNDGLIDNYAYPSGSVTTDMIYWLFRRAPGFFDVVAYSGNNVDQRQVPHNLSAPPEFIITKTRNVTDSWICYHTGLTVQNFSGADYADTIVLNSSVAEFQGLAFRDSTAQTEDYMTLGFGGTGTNESGKNYIAYLFATLPGISKVGSFTISGSDITVDCGFSSGARFVLIKRSSGTDDWYVFDTVRGYVSGSGDAALKLNSTAAESSLNMIEPHASGFSLRAAAWYNGDYIFYAIA
jgi:hypothetical protein